MLGTKILRPWNLAAMLSVVMLVAGGLEAGTFKADSYGGIGDIKRKVRAAQFLSRTTFGPTVADIDALALRIKQIGKKAAYGEWIDQQLALPASDHHDLARSMAIANGWSAELGSTGAVTYHYYYRDYAWWDIAISGEDQLRQRVAWALAQIFVVGEGPAVFNNQTPLDTSGNPRWLGLVDYYQNVLVENAFGSYRDLLEDMTYHPCMGVWLSSLKNKKATVNTEPDENYAREIMQLFSIGLVRLKKNGVRKKDGDDDAIDTYDNETIKALARVFTGMVYNNADPGSDSYNAGVNLHDPMDIYEQEHDFEAKVAFGGNLVIPARSGTEAEARQDIADLHDYLAHEHPNTAPFLCRLLIQRLVRSNPTKGYIRRVSNVFDDSGGNFADVIKAIYLDREALRSLKLAKTSSPVGVQVTTRGTEHTRLREPVPRFTALLRAFDATPDVTSYHFIYNGLVSADFNQTPYESPSVFNFYLPDYQPPGIEHYVPSKKIPNGLLLAPEFQIMTAVQANRLANEYYNTLVDSDVDTFVRYQGQGNTSVDIDLDFSPLYDGMLGPTGQEPTTEQLDDMVEYLDLLLCHGTLSEANKQSILAACTNEVNNYTINSNSPGSSKERLVRAAVWVVVLASDCAVSD